jgi:hypothetical protein
LVQGEDAHEDSLDAVYGSSDEDSERAGCSGLQRVEFEVPEEGNQEDAPAQAKAAEYPSAYALLNELCFVFLEEVNAIEELLSKGNRRRSPEIQTALVKLIEPESHDENAELNNPIPNRAIGEPYHTGKDGSPPYECEYYIGYDEHGKLFEHSDIELILEGVNLGLLDDLTISLILEMQ